MSKKDKKKNSGLLIPYEFGAMFDRLSDSERGKLLTILMAYKFHGIVPDDDNSIPYGIFLGMQPFIGEPNK